MRFTDFPTLHDAKIKKISIDLESKTFSLTVDYSDFVKEPGDSISTRITIVWINIQSASFNWFAEDLYGMKFQRINEFIKTKFTDYSFGFDGEIISSKIEITEILIEPKNKELNGNKILFSIN